ncbi:hypothetical protein DXG01_009851, partial [Tephrocybe rancida]
PPVHDPDCSSTLSDMIDHPPSVSEPPASEMPTKQSPYHPYPNKNSFSLGNWYWNQIQKSQEDFQKLLNIIGNLGFTPCDVQSTPWNAINKVLGRNDFDEEDNRWEWEDEDAGWRRTRVTLDDPFHSRMQNPGTKPHVIGDLYHRSIVSVLKEKLANSVDDSYLHYEPYELSWSPTGSQDDGV